MGERPGLGPDLADPREGGNEGIVLIALVETDHDLGLDTYRG